MKKYDDHGIELIFLENKRGEKRESSSPFQTTSDEDEGTLGITLFSIYTNTLLVVNFYLRATVMSSVYSLNIVL